MIRLGDEHRLEAAGLVPVGTKHLKLVQPLHVECERALRAVDLPLERVPPPEREPCRLERPDRSVVELDRGLEGIVDLPSRDEGLDEGRNGGDLPHQVPREVDHMSPEVADRTGAGLIGVEAPRVERRIVAPILQVPPRKWRISAESPPRSSRARADRRHEPVVERAQMLDARRGDALPDIEALGGIATERLLAQNVLSRLRGGDRRLPVQCVRAAVVEQADRRIGDDIPPVGRPPLVPVAARASATAASLRPAIDTRRGCRGGGQAM